MTNRVMKIIGTAALSISLITGASNAVSANEMSPSSLKDKLTWDLKGNTIDPTNTYSVTIGYPNIKLYSKNTGAISYRIEVMHNSKKRVIFNETVAAGKTVEVVNNDLIPLVPSGTYTVTIYGGGGLPKGQVVLKSSDTKWP